MTPKIGDVVVVLRQPWGVSPLLKPWALVGAIGEVRRVADGNVYVRHRAAHRWPRGWWYRPDDLAVVGDVR